MLAMDSDSKLASPLHPASVTWAAVSPLQLRVAQHLPPSQEQRRSAHLPLMLREDIFLATLL